MKTRMVKTEFESFGVEKYKTKTLMLMSWRGRIRRRFFVRSSGAARANLIDNRVRIRRVQ